MISVKKNALIKLLIVVVGLSLLLTACKAGTETVAVTEEPPAATEDLAADTGEGGEAEETSTAVPQVEDSNVNPLPVDPITQTFTASDGTELEGTFYPAATTDAPLLVLMHWAPGDQSDWKAIAAWLQNRGLQPDLGTGGDPWLDSSWFPVLLEDVTFNVFTFTFRGCEGGCQSFDREGWKLDVEAAMLQIIGIENVDLSRVLTIGASIGADGAAYGCHFYNSELGGCLGAFSLSPGGYLTVPYADEVALLENELLPRPAWCLYSAGDSGSAAACQEADGQFYLATEYEGTAHGMSLISPGVTPNPLDELLRFIELYLD
ncbi:MAG TPA: hypothetical protein DF984_02175 [Anaerolineaceae bacterium]|nr:hypothetical protein [Anaerolineaceae bacterium]